MENVNYYSNFYPTVNKNCHYIKFTNVTYQSFIKNCAFLSEINCIQSDQCGAHMRYDAQRVIPTT